CGARSLAPEPKTPVMLAGSWRLNRAASQDPLPMIDSIQRDMMKRMRRYYRNNPDDVDGGPEDGGEQRTEPRRGGGQRSGGQTQDPRQGANQGSSQSDEQRAGPRASMQRGFMRSSYAEALGPQLSAEEGLVIQQSADKLVFIRGESHRSFT